MKKISFKNVKTFGIELIFEILLSIVAFFIGWGILSLFGYDISFSDDSADIALLIGAMVSVAVIILVAVIFHNIKRKN